MNIISIPKNEYENLVEAKLRYEYLRQILSADIFSPPPTRDIGQVMREFKATKKYNQRFLKSLEQGLRRSTHFKS